MEEYCNYGYGPAYFFVVFILFYFTFTSSFVLCVGDGDTVCDMCGMDDGFSLKPYQPFRRKERLVNISKPTT
jgi:hypothetical protein